MILTLFRGKRTTPAVESLYDTIVEQSRLPIFYIEFGIPDTLDARFDMQVLHTYLIIRRLQAGGESKLAQELFDLFFHDMDRTLRQIGVSDTRVPKKIKSMVKAFYGRCKAYGDALDAGDEQALAAAIGRNLGLDEDRPLAAKPLASYVFATMRSFDGFADDELIGGAIEWPMPSLTTDHSRSGENFDGHGAD